MSAAAGNGPTVIYNAHSGGHPQQVQPAGTAPYSTTTPPPAIQPGQPAAAAGQRPPYVPPNGE